MKGCVFSNWDANFKRLESFVLAQAAAGNPVVLGPVQSTMYPLGPKVSLSVPTPITPFRKPPALSLPYLSLLAWRLSKGYRCRGRQGECAGRMGRGK